MYNIIRTMSREAHSMVIVILMINLMKYDIYKTTGKSIANTFYNKLRKMVDMYHASRPRGRL